MIPPIWLWARRLHEPEEADEDHHRQQERQQADEPVGARRRVLDVDLGLAHGREVGLGDAALERAGGAEVVAAGVVGVGALDRAVGVVDLDALDLAGPHRGHEVGVGDRVRVAGAAQQRAQEQHAQREAEQRPQAPAGHALPRKAAAPRPLLRRGRRGRQTLRAHGDRIRVGSLGIAAGRTVAASTVGSEAVDSVPAMSSRTCAKPGCNTSASATLTYDYAGRTAWVEHLNDEAHPMRYDLCSDHADALTVPDGLGAAGSARALPRRRSPPDFRGRPGPAYPAPVNEVATAPVPSPPEGPALGPRRRRCVGWVVVYLVSIIWGVAVIAATGHAGEDFDDLPLGVVALAQLGLAVGFFLVPVGGDEGQGQRDRRRPRAPGPLGGPLEGRAGGDRHAGGAAPAPVLAAPRGCSTRASTTSRAPPRRSPIGPTARWT